MSEPPTPSAAILAARIKWQWTGSVRPPWAVTPRAGEESVWDYPRPPAISTDTRSVVVRSQDHTIAQTNSALRVLETASPPTFYVPLSDVDLDLLTIVAGTSTCEWKGAARYWALLSAPQRVIAWEYPNPFVEMLPIAEAMSFYPALVECSVDGEIVRPQPGGFYGGWVTNEIVGPIKGDPESESWW